MNESEDFVSFPCIHSEFFRILCIFAVIFGQLWVYLFICLLCNLLFFRWGSWMLYILCKAWMIFVWFTCYFSNYCLESFWFSFAANYSVWALCIYILIVNRLRILVMRVRFNVEWLFPIKFYVNCGSWSLILVHRLQGFLDMICSCRLFLLVCVRFCSRRFCSPIFRKLMSKSCVVTTLVGR